jgi:hypothetical protein
MRLKNLNLNALAAAVIVSLLAATMSLLPWQSDRAFANGAPCTASGISGYGTDESPFLISSSAELNSISECVVVAPSDSIFRLTDNIDLSPNNSQTPIDYFSGTLDGDGFSITGISLSSTVESVGLFKEISGSATVSNITITGEAFSSAGSAALLAPIATSNLNLIGVTLSGTVKQGGVLIPPEERSAALGVAEVAGHLLVADSAMSNSLIVALHKAGGFAGVARSSVSISNTTIQYLELRHVGDAAYGAFGGLVGDVNYGDFEARGIQISDVGIDAPGLNGLGGVVGGTGEAVILENVVGSRITITGRDGLGGLVGESASMDENLTMTDVQVTDVSIFGSSGGIGGAVGFASGDLVVSSVSATFVTIQPITSSTASGVGGLVGSTYTGDSVFSGIVISEVSISGFVSVGALLGFASDQTTPATFAITLSSVVASEITLTSVGKESGGLIGRNDGYLEASDIQILNLKIDSSESETLGGLVGLAEKGASLSGIVATNLSITGKFYLGGLVGESYASSPQNSMSFEIRDVHLFNISIVGSSDGLGGAVGYAFADLQMFSISAASISIRAQQVEDPGPGYGDGSGGLAGDIAGEVHGSFISVRDLSLVRSELFDFSGGIVGATDGITSLSNVVVEGLNFQSAGGWSVGAIRGGGGDPAFYLNKALVHDVTIVHDGWYAGGLTAYAGDAFLADVQISSVSFDVSGVHIGGLFGELTGAAELSRVNMFDLRFLNQNPGLRGGGVGGSIATGITATESFFAVATQGVPKISNFLFTDSPEAYALNSTYVLGLASDPEIGSVPNGQTKPANKATALTATQFQSAASFAGWDFETVWGYDCFSALFPQLRVLVSGLEETCVVVAQDSPNPVASQPTYTGPVVDRYSTKQLMAGENLTLFGSKLDGISSVLMDGKQLIITSQTSTELGLRLPGDISAGVKDLVILSSAGRLTILGAIEITETAIVEPTSAEPVISFVMNKGSSFVAIRNAAGREVSVRIAGKWQKLKVTGDGLVQIGRKTGSGVQITIQVYVDRVLLKSERLRTK